MIRELISTSAPRCLNGNAGFGVVAQTSGMAHNVSQAVGALSGYTHVAPPGSPQNPVVYMHAVRKTGGVQRHIVSRVADCGNDYSGRSNRIAHHWIIEENALRNLPGGPSVLIAQNIKEFRSNWNEKPAEWQPKTLSAPNVAPGICNTWKRLTGDAGWGGVVAEHAEKGNPVSIVFPPGYNSEDLRALISEALALLPASVRWRVTFSTYYMKSQETSGDKIQVKCFLAGSEEAPLPNALRIDLRQPLGAAPVGKYTVLKTAGMVKPQPKVQPSKSPQPQTPQIVASAHVLVPEDDVYEIKGTTSVPGLPGKLQVPQVPGVSPPKKKSKRLDYATGKHFASDEKSSVVDKNWLWYLIVLVIISFVVIVGLTVPSLIKMVTEGNTQRHLERRMALLLAKQQDERRQETIRQVGGWLGTEWQQARQQWLETTQQVVGWLEGEWQNTKQMVAGWQQNEMVKVAEAKREAQEVAEKLENLPEIWRGLARARHPPGGEVRSPPLEGSEFLHGEDVKLKYVSFVDLRSSQIDVDNDRRTVTFKRGNREFARIDLVDNGLQFKWTRSDSDRVDVGVLEREVVRAERLILLSELRVTIGDNPEQEPKRIALWEPDDNLNDVEKNLNDLLDNRNRVGMYLIRPETNEKLLLMETQPSMEGETQ